LANQSSLKEVKDAYISSLNRSLCLALDDFYRDARYVFTSAMTGEGYGDLWEKVGEAREEYRQTFWKDLGEKLKGLELKSA
jgi:hypothetical protein